MVVVDIGTRMRDLTYLIYIISIATGTLAFDGSELSSTLPTELGQLSLIGKVKGGPFVSSFPNSDDLVLLTPL